MKRWQAVTVFGLKRCQHKAESLARSRIEAQNIDYMGLIDLC